MQWRSCVFCAPGQDNIARPCNIYLRAHHGWARRGKFWVPRGTRTLEIDFPSSIFPFTQCIDVIQFDVHWTKRMYSNNLFWYITYDRIVSTKGYNNEIHMLNNWTLQGCHWAWALIHEKNSAIMSLKIVKNSAIFEIFSQRSWPLFSLFSIFNGIRLALTHRLPCLHLIGVLGSEFNLGHWVQTLKSKDKHLTSLSIHSLFWI